MWGRLLICGRLPIGLLLVFLNLCAILAAEAPAASSGPMVRITATTANVAGAPDSIRIDVFRWSTDAERERLVSAWNLKPAGRGRGQGAPAEVDAAGNEVSSGRGRGGRGAGRAGTAPAPPLTPESSFAAALKQATTVGYLWSSEIAGYTLRYAGRIAAADGSAHIILITDRRLGEVNDLWTPAGGSSPSPYGFSVIELRINSKGEGEGRVSFTGKLAPDDAAGMITSADYSALPVILTKVKVQGKP